MRNWHRWVMTVFGVALLYWLGSGLIVTAIELIKRDALAKGLVTSGGAEPNTLVFNNQPLRPILIRNSGGTSVIVAARRDSIWME